MSRRIAGGLMGWVAGALPLAAVNVADYLGIFSFSEGVLAGTVALLAGIFLGGVVAGSVGGRPEHGRPGGASDAAVSGGIAAALFAVSVILLMAGTAVRDSAFNFDAMVLVRFALAVVFFAALLMGVALIAGAVAGRRAWHAASSNSTPLRSGTVPTTPRAGISSASRPVPRGSQPIDRRQPAYGPPPRGDGWYADPAYRQDDHYTPAAHSAAPPSSPVRRPSGPSRAR